MKKSILPIGTIINLKENDSLKFMIVGYFPTNKDGERRDYAAVRYPMGVYDNRMYFFFNDVDIGEVIYSGYEDDEFTTMCELINQTPELSQ